MEKIISSPLFGVTLTLSVYAIFQWIYKKFPFALFHPVFLTIVFIISFLMIGKIRFEAYNEGGKYISFLLGPSVVALGVLFYEKMQEVKKNLPLVFISIVSGGVSGMISAGMVALLLTAPEEVVMSMVPKSVTTPIAIEVSTVLNGVPPLTAAVVVATGIFGAATGPLFLKLLKINNSVAFGLSMGTAAHGVGTARALETGTLEGAMSGLALCINGLITALLAPYIAVLINFL